MLRDALVSLILEKDFASISIKEITQRADVAYITFFALPQKSLWGKGGRKHFPTLDKFFELPFGLLNRTGM